MFHTLNYKLILKTALLRFQCWYAKRPERKQNGGNFLTFIVLLRLKQLLSKIILIIIY